MNFKPCLQPLGHRPLESQCCCLLFSFRQIYNFSTYDSHWRRRKRVVAQPGCLLSYRGTSIDTRCCTTRNHLLALHQTFGLQSNQQTETLCKWFVFTPPPTLKMDPRCSLQYASAVFAFLTVVIIIKLQETSTGVKTHCGRGAEEKPAFDRL